MNAVQVGLYFAVQEGMSVLIRPLCGRFGDRSGHLLAVLGGMILLALALLLLATTGGLTYLFMSAILAGLGQALIAPNTISLISSQLHTDHLGTGLGLLGTLQNGSKVVGPLLAGVLVRWFDYTGMFLLIGYLLLATTLLLALLIARQHTRGRPRQSISRADRPATTPLAVQLDDGSIRSKSPRT